MNADPASNNTIITPGNAADVIRNGNPYFDGKPASITREYPTQLHAIGPDGRLRLGAAFDLMQDIAGAHSTTGNSATAPMRAASWTTRTTASSCPR